MMAGRFIERIARLAWPGTSIDPLLRAATLEDGEAAAAAWRQFEAQADFDKLSWGQLRLISLAARRISDFAPDSPMRPRIAGIERSIWTRSQKVVGEARSALRKLSDASVPILTIKGAGRAAGGAASARGRIVNDIDILVNTEDLETAFDILVADGWTPSSSGSPLYNRTRLGHATGINFVRGEFGNIDLHRTAFHSPFDEETEDAGIWARSLPGRLGGIDLRIPAPLDAIVIAIAHGTLDAHKSSDWLADIAQAIDEGGEWENFVKTIGKRGMAPAALAALCYVRDRLDRDIPAEVMAEIESTAAAQPLRLAGTIAEARPKSERFDLAWLARAATKQRRLFRGRRKDRGKRSPLVLASPFGSPLASRTQAADRGATAHLEVRLPLPGFDGTRDWSGSVEILLIAETPPASRRIEFEINCGSRHMARLRAVVRDRGARDVALRFRVPLHIAAGEPDPQLLAVPARSFNTKATQEELDRYGAVPFRLTAVKARPS
ncbi:MAG: hypothetical protein CML30_05765 [Rhizobiales bacterium]|nr:hypothetical protein [Hyphomicrobiales bacterium]